MPKAEFFTNFGIFTINNFLETELCARVISEAGSNEQRQATVIKKDLNVVDENTRRTRQVAISDQTTSLIRDRLTSVKPLLEHHFNLNLTDCQRPQFLVYKEGDFFQTHRDVSYDSEAVEYTQRRQVSVILFLNDQAQAQKSESYCGGSLVLYGLVDDPKWENYGFPLEGESGLLIAFRSNIAHEVKPVTCGERFTVVSWFF